MHIKARNDDSEDRVFEDKGFFAKGPEFSRVTPDWITSLDSYAIPIMHGGVDAVKPYVDEFIEYAKPHPELTFLVTRIGCGIAGFRDEQMAPLFKVCLALENVFLPKTFVYAIN